MEPWAVSGTCLEACNCRTRRRPLPPPFVGKCLRALAFLSVRRLGSRHGSRGGHRVPRGGGRATRHPRSDRAGSLALSADLCGGGGGEGGAAGTDRAGEAERG